MGPPGKNTGVGCDFLLQLPTHQALNVPRKEAPRPGTPGGAWPGLSPWEERVAVPPAPPSGPGAGQRSSAHKTPSCHSAQSQPWAVWLPHPLPSALPGPGGWHPGRAGQGSWHPGHLGLTPRRETKQTLSPHVRLPGPPPLLLIIKRGIYFALPWAWGCKQPLRPARCAGLGNLRWGLLREASMFSFAFARTGQGLARPQGEPAPPPLRGGLHAPTGAEVADRALGARDLCPLTS